MLGHKHAAINMDLTVPVKTGSSRAVRREQLVFCLGSFAVYHHGPLHRWFSGLLGRICMCAILLGNGVVFPASRMRLNPLVALLESMWFVDRWWAPHHGDMGGTDKVVEVTEYPAGCRSL